MTRISSPPSRSDAGFTLVEVLVVLAIMASIAVLAVPAFRRQGGGIEFQQEAARLHAELAQAQRQAVSRAAIVEVRLPDSVQYRPILSADLAQARAVRFYADGSSSGGEVLSDGRPLLEIDWLSGEVRRARPQEG